MGQSSPFFLPNKTPNGASSNDENVVMDRVGQPAAAHGRDGRRGIIALFPN
jgi:hypothetical protein